MSAGAALHRDAPAHVPADRTPRDRRHGRARSDLRILHLLFTPAAVRFLSCEPMLGPVPRPLPSWMGAGPTPSGTFATAPRLHWVIVGGESGHGAREMHLAWGRTIVEQCKAAGTKVFVKQLGARPVRESEDDRPGRAPSCFTNTFVPAALH